MAARHWVTQESDIIANHHVNQPKPIRVVVLGAGISGIAFTYKARGLENVSFQIYEKNSDVGGTWFESTYPGVSCDVPAHCYTFTWAGNPDWTRVYASGQEIVQFYQQLARDYGVYEHTKFKHQVVDSRWDDKASLWKLTVLNLETGDSFVDSAEVFINSGGVLNNWAWPSIQGLHDFRGTLVHTAHWDNSLDLSGKRVAVIGSGASAIQVVPTIQPIVQKLVSFHRSPSWIAAEFAGHFASQGRNTTYSKEERKRFREDPDYFLTYRREIEHSMNARFPSFYRHSDAQRQGVENVSKSMRTRLGNNPELCEKLIPKFSLGCRRVTPGHGYLEALTADNVVVETSHIAKVTESGIKTVDGKLHEVDAIITATGYVTSFVPRFPIVGLGGVDLQQEWAEKGAQGYLSVTAPSMPNYFLTTGPNSPISNGSLIPAIERQVDFALAFIRKIQTQDLRYVIVTDKATSEFNQWKDEFMKDMTWTGECTSWYKNGTVDGPVIGPWPGSVNHFLEALKHPRFEDFEYTYNSRNRFRYFGDGRAACEAKGLPLGAYIS
ncbi:uncharacterized protein NECHADRAFT_86543 [Fusarium vanettenii 77-13-4]|uniref:FAD/NAD(P)-binding domain-containing protein n=1 Tax=Fusarium vanettenii (strain ATCC MYA-4622 / CBS 123669 / FGSC 9596 / NRRL 45880 / 77-13-4) TaxID=660122 RepID=C7ZHA7_FUSV7|nr:uncharacterized protein NECHADRAFT_86543 [Fusarium vanettenii 77-13-4]EEU36632.1 hypothetical protein NECHADRAFT_86543 [Fusarium vanettenii 77-13-4]